MNEKTKKKLGRPLLVALAGAAAFKALACSPYPPGNLIAPPCPDGGPYPCQNDPQDAGSDGGTTDGGADGG